MQRALFGAAVSVALLVSSGAARAGATSDGYVVVVDYTADAAHFDQLKTLIEGVARASIREPGCRRFDVVMPSGVADHVTLYEVFDDKAAFETHAATPHFKQFVIDSGAIHASRVATPGTMILSLQKP